MHLFPPLCQVIKKWFCMHLGDIHKFKVNKYLCMEMSSIERTGEGSIPSKIIWLLWVLFTMHVHVRTLSSSYFSVRQPKFVLHRRYFWIKWMSFSVCLVFLMFIFKLHSRHRGFKHGIKLTSNLFQLLLEGSQNIHIDPIYRAQDCNYNYNTSHEYTAKNM